MFDKAKFFNILRNGALLGPQLSAEEVRGVEAILSATPRWGTAWLAYALATAYHETAHTMEPISEYGGSKYFTRMYDITGSRPELAKKMGNTTPGDGPKYHGRGFVQLTWKSNYIKAGNKLGIDLVNDPDKAKDTEIAAKIMALGMMEGWFTKQKLSDHLPGTGPGTESQFQAARKIINGTDKAALIAGYAIRFQNALIAAGY